jgi:hypothetical protein
MKPLLVTMEIYAHGPRTPDHQGKVYRTQFLLTALSHMSLFDLLDQLAAQYVEEQAQIPANAEYTLLGEWTVISYEVGTR